MKQKRQMNPIMKKEMMVSARSVKMSMAILGINALLTLVVVLVMAVTNAEAELFGYEYSDLVMIFPILAGMECIILSLIVPIMTSGSISGERERQTLDIMLTTPMKPFSIVLGKLAAVLMTVMLYIISTIPVLAIAFTLGGMDWWKLFAFIGMMLYLGIYVGSIGIYSSSQVKKSIMATVITIIILAVIVILTVLTFCVVYGMKESYSYMHKTNLEVGGSALVLLLNPYSTIVDYFMQTFTNASLYSWILEDLNESDLPKKLSLYQTIVYGIYKLWIPVSIILNLVVSFIFLKLASLKVCVTRNKKKKK